MTDPTGGLYPFLDGSDGSHADALLEDVRSSTLRKAEEITELRRSLWDAHEEDLAKAARLLADAFRRGGKVLAFGNGGSATDAQDLVVDLTAPPFAGWRALPAVSLVQDRGIVTAVGNDVGYEHVFARQVVAYGREGDVAVGFSTSGQSPNLLEAFREARSQGLGTLGFVGYDGGRLAKEGRLDAAIIAPSTHIPRIQEAHATAYHTLVHLVQALLDAEPPTREAP